MMDQSTEALVHALAGLVKDQVAELRELEVVLREQQSAVAGRDVEAILGTLAGQSAHLEALRRCDAERTRVACRLALALGFSTGTPTLRQLAAAAGGALGAELEALSQHARETLTLVERVNTDNHRLIRESLDFVESMLAALSGRAPAKSTYQQSGAIRRSQLDTLVDHSA